MVLDELWAALSGASGAALACCFVAAAMALRWSSRRPARGAVDRAQQRQKATLESMDKAAQHFRLQVMVGVGVQVSLGGSTPRSTFSCLDVCGGTGGGQRRFVVSAGL